VAAPQIKQRKECVIEILLVYPTTAANHPQGTQHTIQNQQHMLRVNKHSVCARGACTASSDREGGTGGHATEPTAQ